MADRQPAVGPKTAPAMAIGFRGVITFTTHDRIVPHGWLTPAALGGLTRIVANVRLRFARAIRFTTTAGLRQPLLVHEAGPLKNSDIRGAQTHVLQERRPSARRGLETALEVAIGFRGVGVIAFTTRDWMVRHGWLTPAAPVCRWANHCSYMPPLCTGESFHSHGWLTPAAPGARRRSPEK